MARVAMLVLNTAHNDTRVQKEAAALSRAGYDVRVFAISKGEHGVGTVIVDGFEITRLSASVPFERFIRSLGRRMMGTGSARTSRTSSRTPDEPPVRPNEAPDRSGTAVGLLRRVALRVYRPMTIAAYARAARAAVQEWSADIVHAHDLNTLAPAARIARSTEAALVYDSHELWRRRNRHGEYRPIARLVELIVERRLIRQCSAVITVSDGISDWLANAYGIPRPTVIRNVPVRTRGRSDHPTTESLAGLSADDRIVLYTGRITSGRGLEVAIDALTKLPKNIHLVMLGFGDQYLETLHQRAAALGVGDRVRQIGPVDSHDVSAVASDADLAVVAGDPICESYLLSLPNKLFEAIQARLPIVASPLPEIRAVVEGRRLGVVYESPERIHEAILSVLEDPGAFSAALETAAQELVWENEELVLVDLYSELPGGA